MTWCRPLYVHRKFAQLIKKYVIFSSCMKGIKNINNLRKLTKKLLKIANAGQTLRARFNIMKLTKKVMQRHINEQYMHRLRNWSSLITKISLHADVKSGLGKYDLKDWWFKVTYQLMQRRRLDKDIEWKSLY